MPSSTLLLQPSAQAKYSKTQRRNPKTKHAFHQIIRGPNSQLVFEIVSKYIKSPVQAWALVNELESTPINGKITYNAATRKLSSKARPDNASKILLLQELQEFDLFNIIFSKNRIKIKKGNLYL